MAFGRTLAARVAYRHCFQSARALHTETSLAALGRGALVCRYFVWVRRFARHHPDPNVHRSGREPDSELAVAARWMGGNVAAIRSSSWNGKSVSEGSRGRRAGRVTEEVFCDSDRCAHRGGSVLRRPDRRDLFDRRRTTRLLLARRVPASCRPPEIG